jgi:non-ribosomal peptide synthetase component F
MAKQVAAELRRRDVAQNALVAVLLPRSIEMVAVMLGIISAGAAYLPLDAAYPAARILDTLADSGTALLITNAGLGAQLPAVSTPVWTLSEPLSSDAQAMDAIAPTAGRDDLAYVIYTSGSTGRPKGVMVSHGNVLRLLEQTEAWFHFNDQDVWTMFHSFAFDFSVWEMWGALLTGARLVLVPFEISRSPEEFYALLSAERVTVLNQTPSAFALLMQVEAQQPALPLSLRYVIFGGEALVLRSLRGWVARHGDASPQLINMYGITETTVHVTYRRIRAAPAR